MNNRNLHTKQLGYLKYYSDKRNGQGDKKMEQGQMLGTAMTAAALQQHLSLSLGLTSNLKRGTGKKKRRAVRARGAEEEYVLEDKPPPPTLAQRYGLAAPPPAVLTEGEWEHVKNQSLVRGDNTAPCVICKEEFGLDGQVLLSCSHMFHKACLKAFERYSGRKTCPMCRRDQYETRVVHEGAKRHKDNSATRIQAAWRGYKVRKWYREYSLRNPPKDPRLRTKYFEKKLEGLTGRMVDMVENSRTATDRLCSDIDVELARSRRVMQTANLLTTGRLTAEKWKSIEEKVLDRGDTECPICIGSLRNRKRPTTLLSCSHIYHRTCIDMFENLTTETAPTCPVCRCDYVKKPFTAAV
ncbi:RING finger protein 32-like [Bolinopsis microptera]|uniref:RING finger protein 32-like n=1 Tax=Bolinopsis microptera TaxID=2820187 RepID=UPI0030794D78